MAEPRKLPLPIAWLGLFLLSIGSGWLGIEAYRDREGCLLPLFVLLALFLNGAFWAAVVSQLRKPGVGARILAGMAAAAWLFAVGISVVPRLSMVRIYDTPPVTVRASRRTARSGTDLRLDVRVRCPLKCVVTRIAFRPAAGPERVIYASGGLPKKIHLRPGKGETARAKTRLQIGDSEASGRGTLDMRYEEATSSGFGEFAVKERSVSFPLPVAARR